MERSLADLVVFDVIPLVRTALKETAELTAALQGLAREVLPREAEGDRGRLTTPVWRPPRHGRRSRTATGRRPE